MREPAIDASYQVSVHLAEGFQRRSLKCEKLSDDRRRAPSDGKGEFKNRDTCVYLLQMHFFYYNAYICNSIQISV
jgi:hypothetical protein